MKTPKVPLVQLNQSDFRHLIRGGVIETPCCNIAMQDIGFYTMMKQINEAIYGSKAVGKHKTLNEPAP